MLLFENFKLAISAIRANKMRSFLTMLGIIIGIGSVIAIVSIGDTMRGMISDQFASIGINRAMIYIWDSEEHRTTDLFTIDDMNQIKEAFGDRIEYVVPNYAESGTFEFGRNSLKGSLAVVNFGFEKALNLNITYGRTLTEKDIQEKRKYIVLEEETSMSLFGRTNSVGEAIRVTISGDTEDYYVIGVHKKEESMLEAMISFGDDVFYTPYSTIMDDGYMFWDLDTYANPENDMELYRTQIINYIAKMKNRLPENVTYYAVADEMSSIDSLMATLSIAVGAIAAISLIVGGIGIMNIMLVSVTERTREIGIRKSLGAKTKDVLSQFLIESAILSAMGGIIGVVLGVGIVAIGGMAFGITVVISPGIIIIAVGFSAAVGIFFGIYPASKAAKSDPITALRYE